MLSPLALLLVTGVAPSDSIPLQVAVDSGRREVVIEYRVPAAQSRVIPAHGQHADHDGHGGDHSAHTQRLLRFEWPVTGWLRGVRIELEDSTGAPLPQERLHHVNLLNFDRRQLVHPAVERLYAAGQETRPIMLPASVGIPMSAGMRLGLLAAYAPADLPAGSRIRLLLTWSPSNLTPRPLDVFPVLVDVGFRPGESPAYDLPPGLSERAFEFTMPLAGRLLAVGGHMHDYGEEIVLEDVDGSRVFRLESALDSAGRMLEIPVRYFGVFGRGRPLEDGHRYRLRVRYHNRTDESIPAGAMGEVALLFAPKDRDAWPDVDPGDPAIIADLEGLSAHEQGTH